MLQQSQGALAFVYGAYVEVVIGFLIVLPNSHVEVEWFVSHWWGTPVAVYCDALKRHASEVKAKETSSRPINSMARGQSQLDAKDSKDSSWENTTYWICTFSNNQYKIREELGEVHTESSFYLALHSEGLRGTCMLLDEMAMPLKRSWCLFELLQTIELEEKAQMEAFLRAFSGLLFCTSNGVLNYGSSTVEMSMMIGERLLGLSLRDAEATTEKDKKMIADLVQETTVKRKNRFGWRLCRWRSLFGWRPSLVGCGVWWSACVECGLCGLKFIILRRGFFLQSH